MLKTLGAWFRRNGIFILSITLVVLGSFYWCRFMAQGDVGKMRLALALIGCAFSVGVLIGFVFSSYGDEQATIGRIRDWLLAGITGIGLAEAIEQGGTAKRVLQKFQFAQTDSDFAIVIATALTYTTLGFFFMYFQRELILNVALAAKRVERGRIDGTHQAGLAIQRTLSILPASLLTGVDDIEQITQVAPDEAAHLREILYSTEVETFLSQSATALRDGFPLDWDVVSKVAYIHYYRAYFEPREKKASQIQRATEWLLRALMLNPLHADLTMKYADMLVADKEYHGAAAVLERLATRTDAPALVRQWLGFVLLYVPGRTADAIRYSEFFHQEFPNDADPLFCAACGYAQLYLEELKAGKQDSGDSENRKMALVRLRAALTLDPAYVNTVATKWTEKGEDFECLKSNTEFVALIEEFKEKAPKTLDSKETAAAVGR